MRGNGRTAGGRSGVGGAARGGAVATSRWPRLVGVAAFVLALFLYRSYENRPVLGLWSEAYTAVLVCGVALLAWCILLSARSVRGGRRPSLPARLFDLAILAWGGAYLASALDDRDAASRIVDLNLTGSVAPIATLAEACALGLAAAAGLGWLATRLGAAGRKVLLSAGALLAVALAAEGGLRLRSALAPQTQGFPTYISQQWTRRYVELNSEGFRDVTHPVATPAGQRRLLIVGDSYAFGSGVKEIGDRLGEQLASLLSERRGEAWRSISAARGDSDTLDEIGYLEQMRDFERDAVLLVYVFNDIDYLAPVTPRTVLTEHQRGFVARVHPARLLFLNSYLFQELFVRARLASYRFSDESTPSERTYGDDALLERHLDDLERFVDLASADGTPVWIAPYDVAADAGGRSAARYRRFVERARMRELPVLSLAGAFEGCDPASLRVNRMDGHPNALANALAAESLVEPIAAELEARDAAP